MRQDNSYETFLMIFKYCVKRVWKIGGFWASFHTALLSKTSNLRENAPNCSRVTLWSKSTKLYFLTYFLQYLILKSIKHLNFHAKNLYVDPKLNLQLIDKCQFWPIFGRKFKVLHFVFQIFSQIGFKKSKSL